ncbi:MAG: energy transducer TonB, partial [Flavobacterium sp.]|nr:energy transducer TonB [Flavobacterium sp.]
EMCIRDRFIITTEGKLEDIKVVRGKDKVLKDKVISLFQNAPLWKPAELQGEKVKVQMTYPIRIKSQ